MKVEVLRCGFCGDAIYPDEGRWVHAYSKEVRHEECGYDVAEEPEEWYIVMGEEE